MVIKRNPIQITGRALVFLAVLLGMAPTRGAAQEEDPGYTNLQVLPQDISRGELIDIMLANLQGLGLPRRANRGCLFCHEGSMDVPVDDWDWASDSNPMKDKARVMMAMVRDINGHLAGLPDRKRPGMEVTCGTCHAGRTDPTPLRELLIAEFELGGFERLDEVYRDVRSRYWASDAYDFRVGTLIDVANELVAFGDLESAARVHELNVEHTEDAAAYGGLMQLRLEQAFLEDGVEAMLARYEALRDEMPAEAFRPQPLGALAWKLFRGGQEEGGFALFELTHAEFPTSFVAVENLAWGRELTGDHAGALELAEDWAAANPDHESGQRLLSDIRERGSG